MEIRLKTSSTQLLRTAEFVRLASRKCRRQFRSYWMQSSSKSEACWWLSTIKPIVWMQLEAAILADSVGAWIKFMKVWQRLLTSIWLCWITTQRSVSCSKALSINCYKLLTSSSLSRALISCMYEARMSDVFVSLYKWARHWLSADLQQHCTSWLKVRAAAYWSTVDAALFSKRLHTYCMTHSNIEELYLDSYWL